MPAVPLSDGKTCRWCGEDHGPLCPLVKALEFAHGDERVTRVEFLTAADFPRRQQEEPPPDYPRLQQTKGA